jgi:opacity protein-like surface antigen
VKRLAVVALVLTIAAATAASAAAQTDTRFAFGADFLVAASDHASTEDRAHAVFTVEPLWRFGDFEPGWGPHFGLDWYAVDIERPVGGTATTLGEVHIRPIMGGYGYTWVRGKNTISTNILAGYAFSSMELADGAAAAYQSRIGVGVSDADASNTFVVRPEIDIWHDINKLFGVNVNIGYMVARPDVSITTSNGIDRRTARADQFQVRVGLVYSIF